MSICVPLRSQMLLTKPLQTHVINAYSPIPCRMGAGARLEGAFPHCHCAVFGSTKNNSGNRLRWTASNTNDEATMTIKTDEIFFIQRNNSHTFLTPLPSCRHNAQCHCHYTERTSKAYNRRNTNKTQEIMHRKL